MEPASYQSTARSVNHVVRAMHDGICPRCHCIVPAEEMRGSRATIALCGQNYDLVCPKCFFTITAAEQEAAMKLFAEVMENHLFVFNAWTATLNGNELP